MSIRERVWQVVKFRSGRILWMHGYVTKAEALEAVGLRE